MTNISFKGFNSKALTLPCSEDVQVGDVVVINQTGICVKANESDNFIGICLAKRGNNAAVQVTGYAELPFTGELVYGVDFLAANGDNGVASADNGVYCRIIKIDNTNNIAGFIF